MILYIIHRERDLECSIQTAIKQFPGTLKTNIYILLTENVYIDFFFFG